MELRYLEAGPFFKKQAHLKEHEKKVRNETLKQ